MDNFSDYWNEGRLYAERENPPLPTKKIYPKDIVEAIIDELPDTRSDKSLHMNEVDLKPIATHPDIIDAIKTVYSIRGVGDRDGEYSPERAAGMLKNAARIVQKENGILDHATFIQKIIEFLQTSIQRGKGRPVTGLDELPAEVLGDVGADQPEVNMEPEIPDVPPEEIPEPEMVQDEPEPETEPELVPREEDMPKQEINEDNKKKLEEEGVAAVAGAGCLDGTVNQAIDGVQGIAIKPSRLGGGTLKKRELNEEECDDPTRGCNDDDDREYMDDAHPFNVTADNAKHRRKQTQDNIEKNSVVRLKERIQAIFEDELNMSEEYELDDNEEIVTEEDEVEDEDEDKIIEENSTTETLEEDSEVNRIIKEFDGEDIFKK